MAKKKSTAATPPPWENPQGKETFLGEGENPPTQYVKLVDRPQYPCPNCRRLTDRHGRQAATVMSSRDDVVHLRCRCCGMKWKLKVKAAD